MAKPRPTRVLIFAILVAVAAADVVDPAVLNQNAAATEPGILAAATELGILATEPGILRPEQIQLRSQQPIVQVMTATSIITVPGTGCISAASVEWCLCVLCVRGARKPSRQQQQHQCTCTLHHRHKQQQRIATVSRM